MEKKAVDAVLQPFKFEVPENLRKYASENINKLIADLEEAPTVDKQQKTLKNLSEVLKQPIEDETSKRLHQLFVYLFFTTIESNYPIKRTVARILIGLDLEIVKETFCVHVKKIVQNANKMDLLSKHAIVMKLQIYTVFPRVGQAVLTEQISVIMPFCVTYLAELTDNLNEAKPDVIQQTANLVKFFITFINLKEAEKHLRKASNLLMPNCYQIIMSDFIQFEVKCNASQILVQALNNTSEKNKNKLIFKTPCLQLLLDDIFIIPDYNLPNNDLAMLSLYTSILHLVPGEVLAIEKINKVPVLSHISLEIMAIAKKSSGIPNQAIPAMKTLGILSKLLYFCSEKHLVKLFHLGMDIIWENLDYHVDAVKFNTKEAYKNFIKLAVVYGNKGDSSLIKIVLTHLTDLLENKCSNYVAFTILAEETGTWFVLQYFNSLPQVLLSQMEDVSLAPTVCSTYEALMEQHLKEEDDNAVWMKTWIDILNPLLENSKPPITAYYQRLIIYGFQINSRVINSLRHYQYSTSINELSVLLGCIRWARKNISRIKLCQFENHLPSNQIWRMLLDYKTFQLGMYHQNDEIRIHTLALVVESQKTTEIFTKWELDFLINFFKYNVTCQDPHTIQQIKALYKKALTRIKEGYAGLTRLMAPIQEMDTKLENTSQLLQQLFLQKQNYIAFLDSFIDEHLKKGLTPWANMYRRAICLELLAFSLNCVPQDIFSQYFNANLIKSLYTVLDDSYEHNIVLATTIIKGVSPDHHATVEDVMHNINVAFAKATSINISASLSAAYYLSLSLGSKFAMDALKQLIQSKIITNDVYFLAIQLLVERIEKELVVSQDNILNGAKTAPFYGLLYCIRHIIENQITSLYSHWKEIVTKLVDLCMKVSTVVMPIVNNLNPEGYIPFDDIPDCDELDEAGIAQMILVFAWRTVKEVSLLLGELAAKAPSVDSSGNEIFDLGLSAKVADYYRFIFYETKHRGAYEQAAVGFCKLCNRLWLCKNEVLQKWPAHWVDEVLNMLQGVGYEKIFKKLCSTRRSAGLPFMIIAILTTEPTFGGTPVYNKCIPTLLKICKDTTLENVSALTHSMNILRAVYRHAQLGEKVTVFIEEGIKIAINGFSSSVWGVRNSSTLLFSALMVRIFGVQRNKDVDDMSLKNRMTSRVFFMRYPDLFNFLMLKLKDATYGKTDSLSAHPILLILARLYSSNCEDEEQLIQYLPFVNMCLTHCDYRTRELAAEASVALIPKRLYVKYVIKLLLDLSDVTLSNNHCHGHILQMMALLKNIPADDGVVNVTDYLENTFWIFMSAGVYISHITAALYLNMIIQLSDKFKKECLGHPVFKKMGEQILWKLLYDRYHYVPVNTASHQYKRSSFLLLMQIIGVLYPCQDYLRTHFIKEFILLCIEFRDVAASDVITKYIHCLYRTHSYYLESPLNRLDVVELPTDVLSVVENLKLDLREDIGNKLHCLMNKKILSNFTKELQKSSRGPLEVFTNLQHFVCVLPFLRLRHSNTLAYLLKWVYDCDDTIVCAVIGCINMLLFHSVDSELKQMHFCDLLQAVIYYASPSSTLHERLAVAQLLVHNYYLFCNPNSPISVHNKIKFWNAVIILLEDSDEIIRNTMSCLLTKFSAVHVPLISEKAKEELIKIMKGALPRPDVICLLLFWGLRKQYNPLPDDDGDNTASAITEVVFDKGDLNNYAEDESLTSVALTALKEMLWQLGCTHNISMEEHMYLVSTELFAAIRQGNMFPQESKSILLLVLKGLIEFLKVCPNNSPNFQFNFENRLIMEIINVTFKMDKNPLKHTAADRFKNVFRQIFNIKV